MLFDARTYQMRRTLCDLERPSAVELDSENLPSSVAGEEVITNLLATSEKEAIVPSSSTEGNPPSPTPSSTNI